jgi:CubicO group peptidase (beta-lactamase class C family)
VRQAGTDAPVNDTTVFEAASLSKPVVAWAALRLVDQDRLGLDVPLSTYLGTATDDGLDALGRTITARQVLSHTSGLPNWRPAQAAQVATAFTPGNRFSYSGEGLCCWAGLWAITGSLWTASANRVLVPLGMAQQLCGGTDTPGDRSTTTRRAPIRRAAGPANAAASLATTARLRGLHGTVAAGQGLRPDRAPAGDPATPVVQVRSTDRPMVRPNWPGRWASAVPSAVASDLALGRQRRHQVAGDGITEPASGLVVLTNSRNGSLLFRDLLDTTLGWAAP